jgi:hypothetical protein
MARPQSVNPETAQHSLRDQANEAVQLLTELQVAGIHTLLRKHNAGNDWRVVGDLESLGLQRQDLLDHDDHRSHPRLALCNSPRLHYFRNWDYNDEDVKDMIRSHVNWTIIFGDAKRRPLNPNASKTKSGRRT